MAALTRNTAEERQRRISIATARNKSAASRMPVYFAPAMAPAVRPAAIVAVGEGDCAQRAMRITATTRKKAIQMSGVPAVVICQNATGVSRKRRPAANGSQPLVHFDAR